MTAEEANMRHHELLEIGPCSPTFYIVDPHYADEPDIKREEGPEALHLKNPPGGDGDTEETLHSNIARIKVILDGQES
eukprot:2116088-Pyramimonas_sp.AAC.1